MADISALSDADLDKAIALKQNSLSSLSDEDLDKAIAQKQSSAGQAAIEHFGKGLTAGYLPQIQAASEKIIDPITNAITGYDGKDLSYVQARDANIARQAKEAKDNPTLSKAAEIAGGITSGIAATPLLPGLGAATTIGGKIAQGALQGARVGAIYGGASNPGDKPGVVADSLQLPERIENAGRGAAVGGALAGAVSTLGQSPAIYKAATSNSGEPGQIAVQSVNGAQAQDARASANTDASAKATTSGGDISVEQGGTPFSYKAPKNLEELNAWKPPTASGQTTGPARLQEIDSNNPDLQTKPLQYHYDMMENPKAMKELKLQFENLPTDSAKKIATYNQAMVNEAADKTQQAVNDITGSEPKSLVDAGNDLIGSVKDKYDAEKEALGPVFQSLQKSPGISPAESKDLLVNIGENSKIGKLMQTDPATGRVSLAANTPRTGISDSEYGILSRVVDDLNDGMSFKDLQNSRDFMRKSIDPSNPKAMSEVSNVRSLMLGQMENMAGKRGDDVASAFKGYAMNERMRENVEKIIGGSIDNLDAMYAANPERVVQKIFSNPNYAKTVGEYIGQDKMNEMAQSYLNTGVSKAFDSAKGFMPSTLKTWLNSNAKFMDSNLDPAVTQRLKDMADYGYYGKRFLDEVNPSGTAASLKEMIEPGTFFQMVKQKGLQTALESKAASVVQAVTKQKQAISAVNESLGTPPKPSILSTIGNKVSQSAGAIANSSIPASSAVAAKVAQAPASGPEKWTNDGFNKIVQHVDDPREAERLNKLRSKFTADPKIRDLLQQASDLKPGTKAMQNIYEQIRLRGPASEGE